MHIAVIVNKHHTMNTTDDELVLALLLYVYILKYIQLERPRHPYIPPIEYQLFEFSLDAWDEERQRRMMR